MMDAPFTSRSVRKPAWLGNLAKKRIVAVLQALKKLCLFSENSGTELVFRGASLMKFATCAAVAVAQAKSRLNFMAKKRN